jgi:TonB family protein
MSKIKSRKITYAKIILGVILAGSLTASFAFEQKKSTSLPQNPEGITTTLILDGSKLQITSDKAGLEKLMNAITESNNYDIDVNVSSGHQITLLPKSKREVAYKNKENTSKTNDDVFVIVDEMPEYPGGVVALKNFLAQTVKYPAEAAKKGIQGKVYVTFVVQKDGNIGETKIARGVSPELNAEALRVVKLLTNWKPGKQKGQEVAVQYTVPINFALQ